MPEPLEGIGMNHRDQKTPVYLACTLLLLLMLLTASSPLSNKILFATVSTVSSIKKLNSSIVLGNLWYTYTGHTNMVFGLAWSPNGKQVASASLDGTVQVWDAQTGQHAFVYHNHTGGVFSVF